MPDDELLDQFLAACRADDRERAAALWEARRLAMSADEREAEDEALGQACAEHAADQREQRNRLN